MKKSHTRIISLLPVSLVVGILTAFVMRPYHHVKANRVLIATVKADDTHSALASLKAPDKEIGPSRLAQAVQHNDTVLVKALLAKGATDVNDLIVSQQFTDSPTEPIPLLAFAAEAGNLAICQALVARGADVNLGESNCALKMAATRGHSAVIRFLFQHGAKLDTPSDDSIYSLREAAESGDRESVRLLLAHGADAKYEGRWGSVLGSAIYGGKPAIVQLVVEAGADVNGGFGFTNALQIAAESGNVEIVRYLLQKGAKVNAECEWNRTPLMEAAKEGHTAVVKLLLEHGADWRPKEEASGEVLDEHGPDWRPDNEPGGSGFTPGDTALRIAQRKGNKEVIRMLKKAGAQD